MPKSIVSQPYLDNHIAPMWEVDAAATHGGARGLRLGHERFPLADVASFTCEARETRHRLGRVTAMLVFAAFAACILIGVLEFGLRARLLLAVAILCCVALMALQDTLLQSRSRITGFNVRLRDGRSVTFSTHSDAEALALRAVLRGAQGQAGRAG